VDSGCCARLDGPHPDVQQKLMRSIFIGCEDWLWAEMVVLYDGAWGLEWVGNYTWLWPTCGNLTSE
jgi:hypothetical protein